MNSTPASCKGRKRPSLMSVEQPRNELRKLEKNFDMASIRIMAFAAALSMAFAGLAAAQEGAPAPAAVAQSDQHVVAAMFYSGWCASCRLLEPKVNAVQPEFEGAPVDFVKFDFTWGKRKSHEELAAEYGITAQYERFKRGQGYIVFIDPAAGRVLDVVTGFDSKAELKAAFTRAARLGRAAHRSSKTLVSG